MDGQAELVAGAFSADPEKSAASGHDLFLDPARVYGSYVEMARAEAAHPAADRLDFVIIVTPNHQHFGPAQAFLEAGFHVVCDKPVTLDLAQVRALRDSVHRSGKIFALTHNYTGNALVKQARAFVREGRLGTLRKVVVEYSQGWLSTRLEASGQKQASWRTDPARAGAAGCVGDIGTHAENLARYITGLRIRELCADLTSFVEGRALDDDGNILLRYEGGAKGVLHCSQICVGEENALSIRVYGEQAALEWRQESPDELRLKFPDQPTQLWRRGNGYVGPAAAAVTRIPAGHPEGYLEAFGNIYREVFRGIRASLEGQPLPAGLDFPTIEDGVEGLAFIETVVASSRGGAVWMRLPQG